MSCERFKTRLTDFALGAADAELHAHLAGCASCRAELDAQRSLLASINRGLASLVAGNPAGNFAAHVRRRITEKEGAPLPWLAGWMPVTAAGLALIVLVTFWMLRREHAPPERAKETPPAQNSRPPREPQLAQKAPAVPAPSNAGGPHKIRPPREPQSAANREPEVLVPRGEMAAVILLYNANWNGKADGASLVAEARSLSDSLKPMAIAELKIPALEVVPLESGEQPKGPSENR
jgi:hypothetical protein